MFELDPEEVEMVLEDEQKFHEIAKAAFEVIDTNKSGLIDKYELKEMMTIVSSDMEIDPPSYDDIAEVLKELDSNGNGAISLKEFKSLLKEVLEQVIFNHQS